MLNSTDITLTWDLIFKIYVITALTVNIFSLPIIIWLYRRKPAFIKRIDKAIDRFIEGKKGSEKKQDEKPDEKPKDDVPPKSIEELNELNGVANIILYIGDSYRCMLNTFERSNLINTDKLWCSSDEFVGTFDKGNIFTAKKIGTTFLSYNGVRLYYVEVRTRNTEWILRSYIEMIFNSYSLDGVKFIFRKEKIRAYRQDESKGETMTFPIERGRGTLTVHGNKTNVIDKLVIKVSNCGIDETREKFIEYFEPTGEKPDGIQFWYHKWEEEHENLNDSGIDMVAFLKEDEKGTVCLGICRSWRKSAEVEEIEQNPEMIMRQFNQMLPAEELPTTVRPVGKEEFKELSDPKENIEPLTDKEKRFKDKDTDSKQKETLPEDTEEKHSPVSSATETSSETEHMEEPAEQDETDIDTEQRFDTEDWSENEDEFEEENIPNLESSTDDPTETEVIDPTE